MFEPVIQGLARSGSARGARVILEKPFGRDLASARALNRLLHQELDERDVFRIDHYLGKEAVQNLLVFRFANTFLEPIWNRHYIQSVQVTMAEAFGVQGRGRFYEEAGAIRDVVQNHLLQVVGFLAMEPPVATYADGIRDEQAKVFRSISPLDGRRLVRGQFRGYRAEEGVDPRSDVETFAAVRLQIDTWRWAGVPFFIRAGKEMPMTVTEVMVDLKRPPLPGLGPEGANYVRFRLGPDVTIAIGAGVKKPGEAMKAERRRARPSSTMTRAMKWTPTSACSATRSRAIRRLPRARGCRRGGFGPSSSRSSRPESWSSNTSQAHVGASRPPPRLHGPTSAAGTSPDLARRPPSRGRY